MPEEMKNFLSSSTSRGFVIIVFAISIEIFRSIDCHQTKSLSYEDETSREIGSADYSEIREIVDDDDAIDDFREATRENLQKMFGVNVRPANETHRSKITPQFMLELYNTIADTDGVTRRKNPYDAKIVRSFVERGTSLPHLYRFEISGLEINESVIEAELHLFRKRSAFRFIDPAILKSPYYLIRVYQVLEGQSMDEPDVHRLLNVHYVGAHASGWQVFNVKQAVLAWMAGAPNLGLMITASTIFGDDALVEFSRREDYRRSKRPILVLFDNDGRIDRDNGNKIYEVPHYYKYNDDDEDDDDDQDDVVDNEANDDPSDNDEEMENIDSEVLDDYRATNQHEVSAIQEPIGIANTNGHEDSNKEIDYGTQLGSHSKPGQTEFFQRSKRTGRNIEGHRDSLKNIFPSEWTNYQGHEGRAEENNGIARSRWRGFVRQRRSADSSSSKRTTNQRDGKFNFVTRKKETMERVLGSMDVYARARLREMIEEDRNESAKNRNKRREGELDRKMFYNIKEFGKKRFPRGVTDEDETWQGQVDGEETNDTECERREFYVDFEDIGLSGLIIAPKRYSAFHCQGRCDTFLARDQRTTNHATVRQIVHRMGLVRNFNLPCCVPTELRSSAILFFDDNDNVVLKVHEDMIADRCGCR